MFFLCSASADMQFTTCLESPKPLAFGSASGFVKINPADAAVIGRRFGGIVGSPIGLGLPPVKAERDGFLIFGHAGVVLLE